MNFDKCKQDYLKDRLMKLVELSEEEISSIPKENKKVEYEYLKANDIVFINNLYYKKIGQELSNEEIIVYSNIESSKLLFQLINVMYDIKKDQEKIKNDVRIIKLIMIIPLIIGILMGIILLLAQI